MPTYTCETCGTTGETTSHNRKFCSRPCKDKSYVPRSPIDDLKGFSRLTTEAKASVLLGEGFNIVMFDLECTSLKPNVGRILCCSFKPLGKEPYTFKATDRRFFKRDNYDDGALATAIRDELEKYDIVVGWNSKNFDTKFLNSRLLHAGERTKRAQYQIDGMWAWRSKLSAWSGLKNVQEFITPEGEEKTRIAWEQWMRVIGWDKTLREEAMGEIVNHCELDVIVLENVYRRLVLADCIRSLRRDGGIL